MKFHDLKVNSLTNTVWFHFIWIPAATTYVWSLAAGILLRFFKFLACNILVEHFSAPRGNANQRAVSDRIVCEAKILDHLSYKSEYKWAHQTSPSNIMLSNERLPTFLSSLLNFSKKKKKHFASVKKRKFKTSLWLASRRNFSKILISGWHLIRKKLHQRQNRQKISGAEALHQNIKRENGKEKTHKLHHWFEFNLPKHMHDAIFINSSIHFFHAQQPNVSSFIISRAHSSIFVF